MNVHGTLNGFSKLASKMCSPSIPYKFDASTAELNSLAKQVGGLAWPGMRWWLVCVQRRVRTHRKLFAALPFCFCTPSEC